MDKVELINYLFRSFNKDPYQHKDQVKHFLIECQDFEAPVVDRAVREAITQETYLPKAWIIVNKCKEQVKAREVIHEECFLCNGMGLIFSPIYIDNDGTQIEIASKEHKPRLDGIYSTKIIGACMCINGEIYSATRKRVEPWSYIVDGAMDNKWDCVFEADCIVKRYNRIINGEDNFEKNPQIEKLVNKIMGRYEEK
tara:strand:+ start:392 stop:982 length:591 start_codon:yes stop_codon:yes gene_type:complete